MAFAPSIPRAAALERDTLETVHRLLRLAIEGLPPMLRRDCGLYAFTRAPRGPDTGESRLDLQLRGTSLRYSAIVALGAHWLAEAEQRRVLGGAAVGDYISALIDHLAGDTNLGDTALICWAAAQSRHPRLAEALDRLRQRDREDEPTYVVEAAWVISALATARAQAEVEPQLAAARDRLLGSLAPGSRIFPHVTGPGLVRPYRRHVACFADQVYPIQALARLHRSGPDRAALAAADACAAAICELQGEGGQWWWHYDARTDAVIEGYPVYTVHQHAMAPMALFDLAEAGGTDHLNAIVRGLNWITDPAELRAAPKPMILDEAGVTWRKVYRGDPRKIVRGLRTITTHRAPGLRVHAIDRIYRPRSIDRECRPYEFGWLLFTWLGVLDSAAGDAATGVAPTGSAR